MKGEPGCAAVGEQQIPLPTAGGAAAASTSGWATWMRTGGSAGSTVLAPRFKAASAGSTLLAGAAGESRAGGAAAEGLGLPAKQLPPAAACALGDDRLAMAACSGADVALLNWLCTSAAAGHRQLPPRSISGSAAAAAAALVAAQAEAGLPCGAAVTPKSLGSGLSTGLKKVAGLKCATPKGPPA